ncbi:MAG: hypothetical protein ICV74_05900 [Thermoleophilia bacterium]|nr:hypothetical protein [Thermoleophilia bacterium]
METARWAPPIGIVVLVWALVIVEPAHTEHNLWPPTISLTNRAGYQRAAQESYCVFSPPHEGQDSGVSVCADGPDLLPRRLSVVRPRKLVTIRFGRAVAVDDAVASVRVLGRKRVISSFRIRRPLKRWRVRLRPRAYEVEVFGRFAMPDGRTGDTSGSLGVLVSRSRPLRLAPVGAAERPPPQLAGRIPCRLENRG